MLNRGILVRWGIIVSIIICIILSINCVGSNQQPINNSNIEPTGIIILTDKAEIPLYFGTTWITAQLYNKGEPLRKKDVNITFKLDNGALANIPKHNYNTTDESGSTMIRLTSGNMPGRVKVTAYYNSSNVVISNNTYVSIYRWGSIAGLVRDKNGTGIQNAKVRLYDCLYNVSTKKWDNKNLLHIGENPQLANDGRTALAGQYKFAYVPAGTYNISALFIIFQATR